MLVMECSQVVEGRNIFKKITNYVAIRKKVYITIIANIFLMVKMDSQHVLYRPERDLSSQNGGHII